MREKKKKKEGFSIKERRNMRTLATWGLFLNVCMLAAGLLLPFNQQRQYLIEFKGVYPEFREHELKDNFQYLMDEKVAKSIEFTDIIRDNRTNSSICTYISLPESINEAQLASIVHRSTLVRSIVEIWGDGVNITEVAQMSAGNSKVLGPKSIKANETWRVEFRRFGRKGRSGMTYSEKSQLLSIFGTSLKPLHGIVNLTNPQYEFLFLQDWNDYHDTVTIPRAKMMQLGNSKKSVDDDTYQAKRTLFGRIIASGPSIISEFDIKTRPFIGTTTMCSTMSHIMAVAARVGSCDLVLDPFCGTGGLLVGAANLGASVIGSDIDGDTLGVAVNQAERSKNNLFIRKDDSNQLNKSILDNFIEYDLADKLVGLHHMDVAEWAKPVKKDSANVVDTYEFDAIVTDPPYGHREKVRLSEVDEVSDEESDEADSISIDITYGNLLKVANLRLKSSGKLVFFYPTKAHTDEAAVYQSLQLLQRNSECKLKIRRVVPEKLNNFLWRWLVVMTR